MTFDNIPCGTSLASSDNPNNDLDLEEQRRQKEYEDMLDLVRWTGDGGANMD